MSQWNPLWTVCTSKTQWKSLPHLPEDHLHMSLFSACFWKLPGGLCALTEWLGLESLSNIVIIFHKRKQKFHCTQMDYSLVIIYMELSTCWCSYVGLVISALPDYIGGKRCQSGQLKRCQSGHLRPGEWSPVFIKTWSAGRGHWYPSFYPRLTGESVGIEDNQCYRNVQVCALLGSIPALSERHKVSMAQGWHDNLRDSPHF